MSWVFGMRRLQQILWVLVVAVIFIAGGVFGIKLTRLLAPGSGAHEENTATVVEQVQTLSDLVTVKYVLEKVVILDSPPTSALGQFVEGNNRVLLLAHGIVKAGIDLKRLKPEDVLISGRKITLRLPPPQITDAYLDERQTQVIDWQRGFLRTFDKDLEQTARQNAVDDISRAARTDGILNDAGERARLELALFLHQAGFEQVEFVDKIPVGTGHDNLPQF
ncbi:MAG: DUF4230 domain-containing protein [Verrucomicrobiota bacterium]